MLGMFSSYSIHSTHRNPLHTGRDSKIRIKIDKAICYLFPILDMYCWQKQVNSEEWKSFQIQFIEYLFYMLEETVVCSIKTTSKIRKQIIP